MTQNWKKNFVVFIICQGISLLGSSLVQYAITWYVTLQTNSGASMTGIIVCAILPTFFLAPFAGVWADRYDRKKLIMIADGSIALCTLVLALTFMAGYQAIWLLYVASAIRALGSAVQTPCVGAMLPDLVPEEHLSRANGINSMIHSFISLGSPVLGAALLTLSGLTPVFFVDVITAVLAILVMMFYLQVPYKKKEKSENGNRYFSELKEGILYIFKHSYLWLLFAFCALFFFSAAPAAFLTPLQVARNYGPDEWLLSAIEILFSVGMLLGGLLMSTWKGLKNRTLTLTLGAAALAVCTILLGFPMLFGAYLVVMAFVGFSLPILNTPAMVILQERVHPDYLGRVFGVMTMLNSSFMPLGMLVFGPMADVVPIESLLIGTGIVLMLSTLLLPLCRPLMAAGKSQVQSKQEKNR